LLDDILTLKAKTLIVFDLTGYFAHFRKHFSTTSSLSYTFPPRTTLCGVVASILGYDRNEYYEEFSSENCGIGLQVMKPVRRLLQAVNYIMTDDEAISFFKRTFRWRGEPAQIRLELITADGRIPSEVHYRVFFHHQDAQLMKHLEDKMRSRKSYYPPYLGTANNLTTLRYIGSMEAEFFQPGGDIYVSTVIPVSRIKSMEPEKGLRIYREELVPADFFKDRTLKRMESYIYEEAGKPIKVRIDGVAFKCKVNGEEVIGTFL
jgi:CRISPR-associated protein Cas5h